MNKSAFLSLLDWLFIKVEKLGFEKETCMSNFQQITVIKLLIFIFKLINNK